MTPKQKISFVKKMISEKAEISPSGRFSVHLVSVVEDLDFPDEAPVLLSGREQWSIIQKLEEEGFVQNIELDEKKQYAYLEVTKSKKRHSNLYSYIKTIDDFLQQRELFEKFIRLIDIRSIKPKHIYTIPTEERNDDLIQLLIDLGLVEYDWNEIEKQTHRDIGNRIIEFTFTGDKVIELYNRVSGKNSRIKRQALELISKDIGERFTFVKIAEIFIDLGVPESMFIQDTKWRAVFYILSYYASSQSEKDYLKALKIIQETMHPLMFEGDEERAKEIREKYNKWLKYDHVHINDDGKIYITPTAEEWDLGIMDWIDVDGKTLEPAGFFIHQDCIAELWVLWNQVVILVLAYQENSSLDYKDLENIYLEVIEKVEKIIKQGDIGHLSEVYKRPFTSLATAEVETRAKKIENPSILIGSFLLEISGMNPSPSEIIKKMEENANLIERVRLSTKAINGEKIDMQNLSYEQALFLLKLITGYIFSLLNAMGSGYIIMTDERLNAQYIMLLDNLNKMLERKDFEEIKKILPEDLPNNLFENIDDMDIWWEYGGKSGIRNFYGEIETIWIRAGQQKFPLPKWLVLQLNEVDNVIAQHKKTKSTHWSQTLKNIDEMKSKGVFGSEGSDGKNNYSTQEPLKVQIVSGKMEVDGLQDGLKSIVQKQKDNKNRFPHKLPAGTNWNNITIKFENDDNVYIQVKQFKLNTNYKEMGFIGGGKNPKPSEAWAFLKVLAKLNGELAISDRESKDKYKKQKELLAKSLQNYFSLDYDPFYPYKSSVEKQGNSYKIKITLISTLVDNKNTDIIKENDNLGITEYYEKQTPQINEE
ncbi:MAG: hypothetical protein WCY28_02510 [Candidatus Shapirobacteria bacterium]